ncbi:juvenile hormone acid O-methyltransferase isoform X2 [Ixodes scapularis]|uniref:juvenile hormone acid O-methyltransferase isoform X2 n=1 Tax=Ixodes scapularis TaxID=6945 RepID=UPI001A9D3E17|nr:juvenile hormone acid O-methyltransferase isoform X2 [Ixodes scapularis]
MAAFSTIPSSTRVNCNTTRAIINPDAYIGRNSMQRQDNLRVLDLFQSSFMDDIKKPQILDVGCGTGDFTRDHLLPRCPDVERIVAVDISQDMVEFAREHFAHPKIRYDVFDISRHDMTEFVERYGQFDRVYSFFCLSWTNDQETALKNIEELLKPGGGCLLLFTATSSIMRLRKKLSSIDHWQKYRKMIEYSFPPSVDLVSRDALLSYISGLLKKTSLIPTTCEVLQVTHTYSSFDELAQMHMSLNRLSNLVPKEEKPLLLKDVTENAARLWAEKEAGGSPFCSSMFLVRAQKP